MYFLWDAVRGRIRTVIKNTFVVPLSQFEPFSLTMSHQTEQLTSSEKAFVTFLRGRTKFDSDNVEDECGAIPDAITLKYWQCFLEKLQTDFGLVELTSKYTYFCTDIWSQ
jgi:hypothetical protein